MNRHLLCMAACAVLLAVSEPPSALAQSSAHFKIRKSVADQAGAVSSSSHFKMLSSIGQPGAAWSSSSAGFKETSGFLAGWAGGGLGKAMAPDTEFASEEEVNSDGAASPKEFKLSQNYPNPFNPETFIEYQLPEPAEVKLVIYNMSGREVWRMTSDGETAGFHRVRWDGTDASGNKVTSGAYVYRIEVQGKEKQWVAVKKMLLVK